jgi:hypothetical protein
MDEPRRRQRDPTVGSEGRKSKQCSSIFKAKVEGNSYIGENEGHVGNEKYASRVEDNPRRKIDKTCSVGATTGTSRENDSRVGNRERKTRTGALGKYRSDEGSHNNTGGGDPDRKECAQEKTQVDELTKKFQALEKSMQEAHTS